ncbi:MAG: hypothetical protein WBG65_01290 [Sulfurimonadaceae bacterium]
MYRIKPKKRYTAPEPKEYSFEGRPVCVVHNYVREGLTPRERHKFWDQPTPTVKTDLLINSTNFARGTFIPVNTPVFIVGKKSNRNFFIHVGHKHNTQQAKGNKS